MSRQLLFHRSARPRDRYTQAMDILFTTLPPVEMTLMASGILVCSRSCGRSPVLVLPSWRFLFCRYFYVPTDAVVLVALLTLLTQLGDLSRVVGAFWIT